MDNINLSTEIQHIKYLIKNSRYSDSIMSCASIIEKILRKMYKEISTTLTYKDNEKINSFLKKCNCMETFCHGCNDLCYMWIYHMDAFIFINFFFY